MTSPITLPRPAPEPPYTGSGSRQLFVCVRFKSSLALKVDTHTSVRTPRIRRNRTRRHVPIVGVFGGAGGADVRPAERRSSMSSIS